MNATIKKIFQKYVSHQETIENKEQDQEDDEEPAVEEKKIGPFDFKVIQGLLNVNGKRGEQILYSLFASIFDDEYEKVSRHLMSFLDTTFQQKIFSSKDYSDGISKLLQNFGEHSMDLPLIHKYTFNALIKPLVEKKAIQLKYLKWVPPDKSEEQKKAEEGEEDIDDFNSSDSQFKLMALVMNDHLVSKRGSLSEFFEASGFKEAVEKRKAKLDDESEVYRDV